MASNNAHPIWQLRLAVQQRISIVHAQARNGDSSHFNAPRRSVVWQMSKVRRWHILAMAHTLTNIAFIGYDVVQCVRPMDSRGPSLTASIIALAVISYILLGLRILSRMRDLWWDDGLHIASSVFLGGVIAIEAIGKQCFIRCHAAWKLTGVCSRA